jgi:formylglycine-generating enzyme required for sulfatase activity
MTANAAKVDELAARLRTQEGRRGETICLHDRLAIVDVDEDYETRISTIVRSSPEATAPPVGALPRGRTARVTGVVAGSPWLRVALPEGRSGFVFAEHLRKLSASGGTPETGGGAAAAGTAEPPRSAAAAETVPPPAPAAPAPQVDRPAPSPTAGPAARPMRDFRDCEQCPIMVALPSGSFEMGSTADASEQPAHRVSLPGFAIGKFEVTQAEWKACVAAGGCEYRPSDPAVRDHAPVMNVSWADAVQYAEWLRQSTGKPYRLPSEAEWEYAARAAGTTPYPWGREIGAAKVNCNGCGGGYDPQTMDVGSFPPNRWGLFDMQGDVAEWVADCWHKTYEHAPANGAAWDAPNCNLRVLRGGSWRSSPADLTVSARNFYDPSVRYPANGFRVAMSLAP